MMKTKGNIQRDAESSLFHDGCCSCEARFVPRLLFGTAEKPRFFVALTDAVGLLLQRSPNKTAAYSVNARNTCPMQITR